ncbi:MAG: hypothetical protein ACYTAN_18885 [Planctomycetota bacterium]|jgi:hypothetical protein
MKKTIKLCQHIGDNIGSAKAMLSPDGEFVGLDIEYRLTAEEDGVVRTLHLPISPAEAQELSQALMDASMAADDRRAGRS